MVKFLTGEHDFYKTAKRVRARARASILEYGISVLNYIHAACLKNVSPALWCLLC